MTSLEETLEAVNAAVAELQAANQEIKDLRDEFQKERSTRRKQIGAVILVVVMLGVMLWKVYDLTGDVKAQSEKQVADSCQTSNEGRQNLREAFYFLADASTASQPKTPEIEKAVADFKAEIDSRFPSRDCPE